MAKQCQWQCIARTLKVVLLSLTLLVLCQHNNLFRYFVIFKKGSVSKFLFFCFVRSIAQNFFSRQAND